MSDKGQLFVIAAPSGGGKTSLVKALCQRVGNVQVSVSHTTRAARPAEQEGKDYYFVTPEAFQSLIQAENFLEYAEVFGHWYGTSRHSVEQRLAQGTDIILEIDWQGARQVKPLFPSAVAIFILPPSLDLLAKRLQRRGQDSAQVVAQRMAQAQTEMNHYHEFDYVLINDDFDEAVQQLVHIVMAQRLKLSRQQPILEHFLAELLEL